MNTTYHVGMASTDITPPVGVCLAGFSARTEPSEAVYLPLRATAVAIDDGTTALIIVAAEVIAFGDLTPRVRGRITELTGVAGANIVLSASHTHCGPATREIDDLFDSPRNMAYVDELVDKIAQIANDAWSSRAESRLRYAVGHCDIAVCRRRPDPDNPPRVLRGMQPYREGPCDHDVPVWVVESPNGELRGVLFSYACHPTSRNGLLIGGDYAGFAISNVEQLGVPVAFLQGCAGDQKVGPVEPGADSFGIRTVEETKLAGDALGRAVRDVIDRDKWVAIDGPIAVTQSTIELVSDPADEDVVNEHLGNTDNKWFRMWAEMFRAKLDTGEATESHVPFEIQTIRFGDDLAISTLPAEMTAEYSLRIKRELCDRFKHVLPLAYTNDAIGYVCSHRQKPEFGYEAWDANLYWFRAGRWADNTEDRIVQTVTESLGVKT